MLAFFECSTEAILSRVLLSTSNQRRSATLPCRDDYRLFVPAPTLNRSPLFQKMIACQLTVKTLPGPWPTTTTLRPGAAHPLGHSGGYPDHMDNVFSRPFTTADRILLLSTAFC